MKKLIEPDQDQQLVRLYNRGMAVAEAVMLETGTRYVLCLVELKDKDENLADGKLLKSIENCPRIASATLLIDHETRETLPKGKRLSAVTELKVRIEDVPED